MAKDNRITNKWAAVWLGLGVMFLTGCPLRFEIPLVTPGQQPIDPALLGVWEATETDYVVQRVDFRRQDERHYKVMVLRPGPAYNAPTFQFEGSLGEMSGRSIILLRTIQDGQDAWYHFSYTLKDRILTTEELQNSEIEVSPNDGGLVLDGHNASGDSHWSGLQSWMFVTE
jgi:hypothetical protein